MVLRLCGLAFGLQGQFNATENHNMQWGKHQPLKMTWGRCADSQLGRSLLLLTCSMCTHPVLEERTTRRLTAQVPGVIIGSTAMESIIEKQIQASVDRGEFLKLKGAGQPLPHRHEDQVCLTQHAQVVPAE
jgi:hypothetical protein